MPDAKNNAKQTGDTHPPDVEETARALDNELADEARPGKGENQAGFLKDTGKDNEETIKDETKGAARERG